MPEISYPDAPPRPRTTRDHFEVVTIRAGVQSPFREQFGLLREAREAAETMAAGLTPRPVIIELHWRQRLAEFVDEQNAIVIETHRIADMSRRIFE
jgi:hypothetical protein